MANVDRDVVVVTGGASGIGAAIVVAYLEAGVSDVYVLDICEPRLAGSTSGGSESLKWIKCDLTDEKTIRDAVDQVAGSGGRLDVLVNNAGICNFFGLDFSTGDFDSQFHTNLRGPMLMVKHCEPLLRRSSCPRLVNIASVAARLEWGSHFLYSCAKAGLEKFTKHLVRDLPWLRSNCILPGVIDTTILDQLMTQEAKAELIHRIEAHIPCGRVGHTEDIADAVLFLTSPRAAYINGASLVVDGGMSHANTWIGL